MANSPAMKPNFFRAGHLRVPPYLPVSAGALRI